MGARELKSCPFCGGEAIIIEDFHSCRVKCLQCEARAAIYSYTCDVKGKAINAWNTRTNTTEKVTIIKEFVTKLKEHKCSYDLDNYHWFEAIELDVIDEVAKEFLGEDYDK